MNKEKWNDAIDVMEDKFNEILILMHCLSDLSKLQPTQLKILQDFNENLVLALSALQKLKCLYPNLNLFLCTIDVLSKEEKEIIKDFLNTPE